MLDIGSFECSSETKSFCARNQSKHAHCNARFLCLELRIVNQFENYSTTSLSQENTHYDNVFCFCCQVISQLETSCLQEVWVDSTTDDHNVVHLKFDYINPDRQTRDYIMESQEDSRVKIRLTFISW